MKKKRFYALALNPTLDFSFSVSNLVFDDINRIENKRVDPGGKGFNVARFLCMLGEDVTASGIFGGINGKRHYSLLKKTGLKKIIPFWIEEETREIFNFFLPDGRVLRINEKGPAVPLETAKKITGEITGLPFSADSWLILSGSLPPGIPENFYAGLINKCRRKKTGLRIALDSDAGPLISGVRSVPDFIKPNLYELERLAGKKIKKFSGIKETAVKLINSGISCVTVTLGEKGAVGFIGDSVLWAVPPEIERKSSVGCGDAFLAGFLHKTGAGTVPAETLRFAVACGTAKVAQEGTKMPGIKDVVKTLKGTRVISCLENSGAAEKLFLR